MAQPDNSIHNPWAAPKTPPDGVSWQFLSWLLRYSSVALAQAVITWVALYCVLTSPVGNPIWVISVIVAGFCGPAAVCAWVFTRNLCVRWQSHAAGQLANALILVVTIGTIAVFLHIELLTTMKWSHLDVLWLPWALSLALAALVTEVTCRRHRARRENPEAT